jgi:lysophospholipase L1-like esterase
MDLSGDGSYVASMMSAPDVPGGQGILPARLDITSGTYEYISPLPPSASLDAQATMSRRAISDDGSQVVYFYRGPTAEGLADPFGEAHIWTAGLGAKSLGPSWGYSGRMAPSISGDGRFVVVVRWLDPSYEVFLIETETGFSTLASTPIPGTQTVDAQLSGDGSTILYVRQDTSTGSQSLYAIDLVSGAQRPVGGPDSSQRLLALTRDGSRLLTFARTDPLSPARPAVVDTATAAATFLDYPFTSSFQVSYSISSLSPDGDGVVFRTSIPLVPEDDNSTWDAYLYDVSSRSYYRLSTVTHPDTDVAGAAISDDGQTAIYTTTLSFGISALYKRTGVVDPPPPPPLTVSVSPSSGPAGTTFGFAYSCSTPAQLSIVDTSGNPVTEGVSIGLAVSGNGVDYSQGVTIYLAGTYRGKLTCGDSVATSSDITVRLGFKYVALGDSYAAGEGVDPYFRDGIDEQGVQTGSVDNRCHRSTRAYAEQVQPGGLGASVYQLASGGGPPGRGKRIDKYGSDFNVRASGDYSWGFLACSGAVTDNVLPSSAGGIRQEWTKGFREPGPQLDSPFLDAATDLVTVTIGGNDVGFADILQFCAIDNCDTPGFRASLSQQIDQLQPRLVQVYAAIRQKAPNARILVLGYPELFPGYAKQQNCAALKPWQSNEQVMVNEKLSEFNRAIKAAADEASVEFIDVQQLFDGHEICTRNAWINGPSKSYKINRKGLDDESFHPTLQGQQAYALAVNQALASVSPY